MKKREMESYCGDTAQLFGIQECVLAGGKAAGTKAYQLRNGNGLEALILADKCMGIGQLYFNGKNIGFLSKAGLTAPQFFTEEGVRGFLRTFEAGFLTTCGLTYMGTPSVVDGQANGLHGVISNTPVEHASSEVAWTDDENAVLTVSGTAREGHLFGPDLHIHKKIVMQTGKNRLEIHDVVENRGFTEAPLMLLYHMNFGYPLLDENVEIYTNYDMVTPRDPGTEGEMEKLTKYEKPVPGADEVVGYWRMKDAAKTEGKALVFNPGQGIAVEITIDTAQLPVLNHWRSVAAGDYVLGLEPGTSHVGGYTNAKKDGMLMMIGAGEKKNFDILVDFYDDPEVIQEKRKAYL